MGSLDDFTLIIPTHNRPDTFKCLVNLLSQYKRKLNLIFLDSSEDETKNKNKSLINSLLGQHISHSYHEFDSKSEPFEKFSFGVSQVKTSYCAFCADDDVVLLEGVEHIIEFLNSNADFAAAHGYYFNFQVSKDGFEIQDVVYSRNNLCQEARMKRVYALFSNYEATFYATYRTQAIKDFFSLASSLNTALWKELILALASVMSGKIYRIPSFYYGRRAGGSLPFNNWHPHEIFSKKPDLYFTEYLKCRETLLNHFHVTRAEEEKIFDLAHLLYLKEYIVPQQLEAFCSETSQESHSKEGLFYKTQKTRETLFQKTYTKRKVTQHKSRLALSMILRKMFLPLGYKLLNKFIFLKPFMKKAGERLVPNVIINKASDNALAFSYNFGSEFFLRPLSRDYGPNQKDMNLIIANMEKYGDPDTSPAKARPNKSPIPRKEARVKRDAQAL